MLRSPLEILLLSPDAILLRDRRLPVGSTIGRSRGDRPITSYRLGRGPRHVSLIAGCHADEPVGPAMLDRLVAWLAERSPDSPLMTELTWLVIPHMNPDGEVANRGWAEPLGDVVDLSRYLRGVHRELPGDDVEFGFPRDDDDTAARPENRAAAAFLAAGGPFTLHGSFHGMGFAAGPWFLLEAGWVERTDAMRDELRRVVEDAGYRLHDVDRGGDKGFTRIDRGFTTRPDSRAMASHFRAIGDQRTAALFRPSSMEFVRSLGGDPLTLVSEMPLFLVPEHLYQSGDPIRPEVVTRLRASAGGDDQAVRVEAERAGIRAMPIRDQMRFQLAYLDAALRAACS